MSEEKKKRKKRPVIEFDEVGLPFIWCGDEQEYIRYLDREGNEIRWENTQSETAIRQTGIVLPGT
ncbi:MAG: hypothetical protein OCU12_07755 [Methanophagales archaeon]|nr:hypothetical protein [Methanophagales archaeon]